MASLSPQWEFLGIQFSLTILLISLLVVVLIPIVLSRVLVASTSKTGPSSVVLLAGPREAGKTSFLLYLQEKTLVATQTSTTPSTVKLSPTALESSKSEDGDSSAFGKPFHLKDTPGHPKLRSFALTTITDPTASCLGIVYMLDSAAIIAQPRLTDTVEYLYELLLAVQKRYTVLSETTTTAEPIPLLIACNKNDLFTALPSAKISSQLQSELGRMKETKRKGLLNAGAGENDDEDLEQVLGDDRSDQITWEGLREFGVDVSLQSGSIKSGSVGGWTSWVSECLEA
ncbi:hypothetical protein H072_7962 [Dactylellina haptotyla CBS 200.50]|uniref:Signal recognition particle receptor subunit beta n=1 Tax=Dactylellina haptotyla (strain CBS 200.50) TaxID=1284197 RepID=S8A5T2_DACHA|nr:hypothetical protein H072_7962 [Dactylellina haptotyla CBS 200.50]